MLVDPSRSGRITTTRPADVDTMAVDGPSTSLSRGGRRAALAHVRAADLATSAQRLLNVRVVGDDAQSAWRLLVLKPNGAAARFATPSRSLFQLAGANGFCQVLVFPTTVKAPAADPEGRSRRLSGPSRSKG